LLNLLTVTQPTKSQRVPATSLSVTALRSDTMGTSFPLPIAAMTQRRIPIYKHTAAGPNCKRLAPPRTRIFRRDAGNRPHIPLEIAVPASEMDRRPAGNRILHLDPIKASRLSHLPAADSCRSVRGHAFGTPLYLWQIWGQSVLMQGYTVLFWRAPTKRRMLRTWAPDPTRAAATALSLGRNAGARSA